MRNFLFFASMIISFGGLNAGAEVDWRKEARHLVGGGDHRTPKVRATLLARQSLDDELRSALDGPDRFLAWDVIAALKRKSLLEDLIRASRTDTTGFSYLTMNALIDSANVNRLAGLYRERLSLPDTPAGAKVILIDNLSRMNVELEEQTFSGLLLSDQSAEVRSASLDYLRNRLLKNPSEKDLNFLRQVLASPDLSEQRKIQLVFLLKELSPANLKRLGTVKPPCPERVPEMLKAQCPQTQPAKAI